jgi:hypothetical protein
MERDLISLNTLHAGAPYFAFGFAVFEGAQNTW